MEKKTQNAFAALCFSERTNMEGIFKHVRVKARELYKDAVENNLEITGPLYWIYTGMDGQPQTVFTIDIVIPVTRPEVYKGKFAIKMIEPMKCLTSTHTGSWEKLPETYRELFIESGKKNYTPTGVCREVYIQMDFENDDNNITEVQVGIITP